MNVKQSSRAVCVLLILLLLSGCGGGSAPLISRDDLAVREAKLKEEVDTWGRERERLQRVGHELLRVMPSPPKVDFVLVEDDVVNLGGTPGSVAVTSGLMAMIESDDELACLLGHELVHIARRHIEASADSGLLMRILAGIVETTSPEGKKGIIQVGDAFGVEFDMEQEAEADLTGLFYGYQAGYDPMAGYGFWERLATEVPRSVSEPLFTIHPVTMDRLIRMRSAAQALLQGGGS
jgi:predicted Zn-dependent protease